MAVNYEKNSLVDIPMNPGANPRVTVSVLDIRRGTKWLRMTVVLWCRIEKNDEGWE